MAGVYAIFNQVEPARLDAVAKVMRYGGESEHRLHSELSYIWLSHDCEQRFAPAVDPESGVHVLAGGRLCWPTDVWRQAERLPYAGGTANRVLLERYLKSGPDSVVPYNGAATIVIWDPRIRCVHLWTDQFGYHPSFVYGDDEKRPTIFTTFPDAVTVDPALTIVPDYVSMAEFLRAWRATPPKYVL